MIGLHTAVLRKNTKKIAASLISNKEKLGESIRDFLMRLNEAILQTEDYFTNIVLATLMSDVQIMHLRLPIRKHMPTLLNEFIKCIDKYIDQQESVVVFEDPIPGGQRRIPIERVRSTKEDKPSKLRSDL